MLTFTILSSPPWIASYQFVNGVLLVRNDTNDCIDRAKQRVSLLGHRLIAADEDHGNLEVPRYYCGLTELAHLAPVDVVIEPGATLGVIEEGVQGARHGVVAEERIEGLFNRGWGNALRRSANLDISDIT